MAWQDYANNVKGYPLITHAYICDLEGNIWGSTPGLNVPAAELKAAIAVVKSGAPGAITFGGLKYMGLRIFDGCSDFKGKSEEAGGNPANALSVAITDKAAVIAVHHVPGEKPADGMVQKTNTAATKVRDYLKTVGY